MPSKHALLGGSNAHIYLSCPPSARLCEHLPDFSDKRYAIEGTQAHSLCEYKLKTYILGEKGLQKPEANDDEMESCTEEYLDFVQEELAAAKAKTPDAHLLVEQQLNLEAFIPESFGTADAVIVSDDVLEVIDFKYGKGVPVDAKENPQLRLYALGTYSALESLYTFKQVKTVVFQPRLSSISSETMTVEELLQWGENYVKPRAKLAFEGKGEFAVGEWCRFCKAGSKCRARAEKAFEVIDKSEISPSLLGDDEIAPLLDKLDATEQWIAAIRQYAEQTALSGKKWPGYKLVEKRTKRRIANSIAAVNALIEAGYTLEDVTDTKIKGITNLEKLLTKKKFEEIVGKYVEKPKGEPTLVKESDKRQEINPVEEMFKED